MIEEKSFLFNLENVTQRIKDACYKSGRDMDGVTLLPVTKNWPVDAVRYCKNSKITLVGENRVQEATSKMDLIDDVEWELIGHLQSNKAKQVVGRFSRIQTVDSSKLLKRLDVASLASEVKTAILLQVNAGEDPAKFGVSLADAPALFMQALKCEGLQVDGLMTIAPFAPDDPSVSAKTFFRLRTLRDQLASESGLPLKVLSMGMSGDLEQAVAEGSTMIRVGSSLFGDRMV